jgi:hypothetical protein
MLHTTGQDSRGAGRHATVPQENWGSTDNRKQHGNRAINTTDRGKIGRRRARYSPYNTAVEHNIPHHTQYVAHGRDRGADTPEGLKPNPIGIVMDTIQGSTQIAGERYHEVQSHAHKDLAELQQGNREAGHTGNIM